VHLYSRMRIRSKLFRRISKNKVFVYILIVSTLTSRPPLERPSHSESCPRATSFQARSNIGKHTFSECQLSKIRKIIFNLMVVNGQKF